MKSDAERVDDARIMKLFRGRCVACYCRAEHVHELIPRSRTKHATTIPNNRVPLCASCHNRAHFDGYSGTKFTLLKNQAIARLISFDEPLEKW
jgi:5-methylcytosine-specific restriction endonuclease McrA